MSFQHTRSYSASRRSSSGWSHAHHPSIPENAVLSDTYTDIPPETKRQQEPDYDRSAEMLVQSWMNSTFTAKPEPVPEAPIPPQKQQDQQQVRSESPSFKSFVLWGNRKVVINIPQEIVPTNPTLLSEKEMRVYERRVQDWAIQNCASISPMFSKSTDVRELQQALSTGRAVVQIPNEQGWNQHVAQLREQKLMALGVSSPQPRSETFSSPDSNCGYNYMYMPQPYYHPPVPQGPPPPIPSRTPITPLSATAAVFVPPALEGGLNISYCAPRPALDSPFEFTNPGQGQFHTPAERTHSHFTPIVQSGTPARDLSEEELDGIVKRLSEANPVNDAKSDEETDSVWSDAVLNEQRHRLTVEAAKRNQSIDDATLEKLLSDALMKKLDPLEKLVSVLTDQLKVQQMAASSGHASDADDEEGEFEEDAMTPEIVRRPSLRVARGSSVENDDRAALRAELEEAKRARQRSEMNVSELTEKLFINEREAGSIKNKLDAYEQELASLKSAAAEAKVLHEAQLQQQETKLQAELQREVEFAAKEREMQRDQVRMLQEQVQLLNDKLRIAGSDAEHAVEKLKADVARAQRERDDVLSHRATELSWLRGLLDAKIEDLDDQARVIKSALGENISRQVVEDMYAANNSAFMSKLKFGTALSLVSDEFVTLLSSVSSTMLARGVAQKERRRSLNRQLENVKPLNEHNNNLPTTPVRFGLKDLRLTRAVTIHSHGDRRRNFRDT